MRSDTVNRWLVDLAHAYSIEVEDPPSDRDLDILASRAKMPISELLMHAETSTQGGETGSLL